MPTKETKAKILDAAERTFADRGFEATSLRTVISEAGVNLAAVHYHFGSKEELVRAVFARRFEPINADRLARLDALELASGHAAVAVPEILRAFLLPAIRVATASEDGGRALLRMIGRAHSEPGDSARSILRSQFDEIVERFGAALALALPALPPSELAARFHFLIGAMATALGSHAEQSGAAGFEARSVEELVSSLTAFASAGFSAPPTFVDGQEQAGAKP